MALNLEENHSMPQIWQIGSGDASRPYDDLCYAHDVMLLGPGNPGHFTQPDYEKALARGEVRRSAIHEIRRFSYKVQPGDVVLLRRGHKVKHIGVVDKSGYFWDEMFDDVFGWDLQHARRVIWQEHLREELEGLQKRRGLFGSRLQIPKFTQVKDRSVLKLLADSLSRLKSRPLKPLPPAIPRPLSQDELGEALFERGLANAAVERFLRELERIRRLNRWYEKYGKKSRRPTEHEVVAHVVLPLFLALGWSEQLLAVEWRRVDLAAFRTTPTVAEHCVLVCEAKGRGQGLRHVMNQAAAYTERLKLSACRALVSTEGQSLFLYTKEGGMGDWFAIPAGYVNFSRIRRQSIISRRDGVDTIMKLTPAGVLSLPGSHR